MQVVTANRDTRAIDRHTLLSNGTFSSEHLPCLRHFDGRTGEPGYMPFTYKGALYFAAKSSDMCICCIYLVDDSLREIHRVCRVDLYSEKTPKVGTDRVLTGTEEDPLDMAIYDWPDQIQFRGSEVYISLYYGIVVIDLGAMSLSRILDIPINHIRFGLVSGVPCFLVRASEPAGESDALIISLSEEEYQSGGKIAKMHSISDTLYVECANEQVYHVKLDEHRSMVKKHVPQSVLQTNCAAKISGERNGPHSLVIPGVLYAKSLPATHCIAIIATQA